jgi:hypothetical protein
MENWSKCNGNIVFFLFQISDVASLATIPKNVYQNGFMKRGLKKKQGSHDKIIN